MAINEYIPNGYLKTHRDYTNHQHVKRAVKIKTNFSLH
jgi:hypothetical protein